MGNTIDNTNFKDDKIDLRELFATIGRYKKSIFFITFIVTIITAIFVYKMPKYFKTSTILEVKSQDSAKSLPSLGGAGALLGLAGLDVGSENTDKEAAQMLMYSSNSPVLDKVPMLAQYWYEDNFRLNPLSENNSSIVVKYFKSFNPKKIVLNVVIKPISQIKYELYSDSIFKSMLGVYSFGKMVKTKDFNILVEKKHRGILPNRITLYGNRHYIFEKIISKNLTIEPDKKNPFINIEYLDTLPSRGKKYVQELVKEYTQLSISREIEDLNVTLNSINKQISDIEKEVNSSQSQMELFKQKEKIIDPKAQIEVLLQQKAQLSNQLMQNSYQLNLIKQILNSIKNGKQVQTVAPSLIEFQDKATIELIAKLQDLELKRSELKSQYTAQYPELKGVNRQIKSIKSTILSNLKNLLSTTKTKNIELKRLLSTFEQRIQKAPKTEIQMTNIVRDYKLKEKLYAFLLQKKATTILKIQSVKSKFRVIEPIYTDYKPDKPKKKLIVIVAFITALILSIFIAFFREFLKEAN